MHDSYDSVFGKYDTLAECTAVVAFMHNNYLLQISSLGFVPQTFEAIVDGIVESVKRAHGNMRSGHLFINTGNLLDASIQRSSAAYQNNPASERAM